VFRSALNPKGKRGREFGWFIKDFRIIKDIFNIQKNRVNIKFSLIR